MSRSLHAALSASVLIACTRSDDAGGVAESATAAAETFIAGFDSTDAASRALAIHLESVREGGRPPAGSPQVVAGCGPDTSLVHPVEMLAAWEITGRTPRGDTTEMRARTWTDAEEDVMGTTPRRYMAEQRLRDSEREWDVLSDGDRWRVCNGARFGLVGVDSVTTWRPAGASRATARARADSVFTAVTGGDYRPRP